HLRFLRSPARLLHDGHGRVAGVEIERNEVTPHGRIRSTGEREVLAAGLVVRAIGYTGEPVPGLPFDEASGTIPNEAGRAGRAGWCGTVSRCPGRTSRAGSSAAPRA